MSRFTTIRGSKSSCLHYLSSLLMCFISLKQSQRCTLDGCSKQYGEMSSLIKHEKKFHGFYRKEQKAQAARYANVNGIFIKDEYEMSASPMWTSNAVSTPSTIFFPSTPSDTYSSSSMSFASPACYESNSDDELLSEMIPELYSTPNSSPTMSNFGVDTSFQSSASCYQLDMQMPHLRDIIPVFDYNSQILHL